MFAVVQGYHCGLGRKNDGHTQSSKNALKELKTFAELFCICVKSQLRPNLITLQSGKARFCQLSCLHLRLP